MIVKKAKKSKEFLDEMMAKRDQIKKTRETVRKHVEQLNSYNAFIDSAETVQKSLLYSNNIEVS